MESLSSPGSSAEAIEKQIAALYSAMLHQPGIKADDNFLHLGGHSLTAAQLLARVRSVFGVTISLRDFFADPTPAGLAAALMAANVEHVSSEAAPGQRAAQRISLDALDSDDDGACLPPARTR